MLGRITLSRFEVGMYLLLVAGVVGDHLSTGAALTRENVYETNPFALMIMKNGLWAQTDVALMIISVALTYLLLRMIKNPIAKYALIFPSLAGIIRLAVTISNITLMF